MRLSIIPFIASLFLLSPISAFSSEDDSIDVDPETSHNIVYKTQVSDDITIVTYKEFSSPKPEDTFCPENTTPIGETTAQKEMPNMARQAVPSSLKSYFEQIKGFAEIPVITLRFLWSKKRRFHF